MALNTAPPAPTPPNYRPSPAATPLTFTLTFSDRIQNRKIQVMPRWFHQHKWPMDRWNQTLQYTLEEAGCITEITAEISLLPQDTSTRRELLCPGDSIFINGSWHLGTKDFSYTLNGSDGCDSIVNAYITSLTWPQPPVVNLDCEVAIYEATIDLPTSWQVTWSNGDTTATTQITTTPASATIHWATAASKRSTSSWPPYPISTPCPPSQTKTSAPGQGLPPYRPLDASRWKVKWLPSTWSSCDTCFTTMLYTQIPTPPSPWSSPTSGGCTYTRTFNLIVENPPRCHRHSQRTLSSNPGPNASWDFTLPPGYPSSLLLYMIAGAAASFRVFLRGMAPSATVHSSRVYMCIPSNTWTPPAIPSSWRGCDVVVMYWCIDVLMYRCTNVPMY